MYTLQERWSGIARDLKLRFDAPFEIELHDELLIQADIVLYDFGYTKGMLLFGNCPASEKLDTLVRLGYGYSVLSEEYEKLEYDLDAIIDILRDWGWSGSGPRPEWMESSEFGNEDLR